MSRLRHPIRSIREPFGTAGLIVACIALVFAMIGGAYAASGLNGKQKKEVKKIAKTFAGKPGATGPAGPAGPAGTNGTNGTNGKDGAPGQNGAPGANGKSVVLLNESPTNCNEGGFTYEIEGSGEENEVCNGEEGEAGETGFTTTLPQGKTETGSWAVGATGAETGGTWATVSFGIPLAADIPAANTHFKSLNFIGSAGEDCPGRASAPAAKAGHLCVYTTDSQGEFEGPVGGIQKAGKTEAGASTAGASMPFLLAGNAFLRGTWAVTAP